jgi:hypothetical protein
MHLRLLIAVGVWIAATSLALGGHASAQSTRDLPAQEGVTCPPDVKGEPPTVGRSGSKPLSDRLADSKGVICPPSGLDQDLQVKPPGGGQLKVIPPPGTPGGDQRIQPK